MTALLEPEVGKKKHPGGRPRKPEATTPIQIRVPDSIAAALQRMADVNQRTRTQELMIALKDRLKAEGFWPPKDAPGEGD